MYPEITEIISDVSITLYTGLAGDCLISIVHVFFYQRKMNEIGDIIQEDLSSVVKYIPNHLSTWKTVQNLMISEHQILTSQSEEYIHVNR